MVKIKFDYIDEISNLSCEIKTLNYLLSVLTTYEQDNSEQKNVKNATTYLVNKQWEELEKLSELLGKEDFICKI